MDHQPLLTLITPLRGVTERRIERSPFVLGRDRGVDLPLDFPWLSRRHLIFEREGDGWSVRTESKNEVLIDGVVLKETQLLAPGARIELGPLTLIFDAPNAPLLALVEGGIDAPTLDVSMAELRNDQRQAPRRYLALLSEISARLSEQEDEGAAQQAAIQALLEAVGGRAACIIEIADGDLQRTAIRAQRGASLGRISRAILERALQQRAPFSAGQVLVAPLPAPLSRVFYVERAEASAPFSELEVMFAGLLAQITGPALLAAQRSSEASESRERLRGERAELVRDIERRGCFGGIVGTSAAIQRVGALISKVAPLDTTVLISGETGSGKELVAREIHQRSRRNQATFFAINCAALPESLVESELFGHTQGAFSGADRARRGIFELGDGGTVFLDEIGELPLIAQAKILRALETRQIMPLGAERLVPVDVRLVAATHRDLAADVSQGRFRRDLYYRLNVFPLPIPPLRERVEDVPSLVDHFLRESAEARRKQITGASPAALRALRAYSFPGNVRELAHLLERAIILADDGAELGVSELPEEVVRAGPAELDSQAGRGERSLRGDLEAYERELILRELERDRWNRTKTAKRLGVSLRAFMEKLRRYDLRPPDGSTP